MILIQVAFVLLLLNLSKCDVRNKESSTHKYTSYINGDKIHNITEYCKLRRCISKCCHGDTVFFSYDKVKSKFICKDLKNKANGRRIENTIGTKIYKSNIEQEIVETDLQLKNFTFVYNDKFFASSLVVLRPPKWYLLEDSSITFENPTVRSHGPTDYCVDISFQKSKNGTILRLGFVPDESNLIIYLSVVMLISSFFCLLILIVYGLLPQLRNVVGMVLMAYVANLLVVFTLRAIHNIVNFNMGPCRILCPIMYLTGLASFFWLNIMSFDIWWTFRGTRICRDIHRRGELVKFLWYCLYAWGIPLAVTISVVVLDYSDVPAYIVKPHFEICLQGDKVNIYYQYIPFAILTAVNCVLFVVTVYNIWLIHYGMKKIKESQTNKRNKNRFGVYLKMSVLMGVSWIIEILQSFEQMKISEPWLYLTVNLYNAALGVPIFVLFVFKRKILIMLCKRLKLSDKWIAKVETIMKTKSRDTTNNSRKQLQVESETEMDQKDTTVTSC